MARSTLIKRSYAPHRTFAVALFLFCVGLLIQAHSAVEIPAQAPLREAVSVTPRSTAPVVMTTSAANTFLRLASSMGQGVPAARLLQYQQKVDPSDRPRYWAIVDFNQPSTSKRLYVFDIAENKVQTYYVSHGRGSEGANDDGIAETFSNEDGSLSSSLGIYRALDEYDGKHGRSLRLEGLEATNSNVLRRGVVMHTADYVSDAFIHQTGRLGRSEGCFAVEKAVGDLLINELKDGAYIIAWKG